MRRKIALLIGSALLSGCAQLASLTGIGGPEILVEPTQETALLVTAPTFDAQAYAIETTRSGTVTTWRTPDNTSLSLDRGVIVSTRGFGDDLMGADAAQSIAAVQGGAGQWAPRINGFMTGDYQSYFIAFQCRRTDSRPERITLGGRTVAATLVTESCVNDTRRIENRYWRNGNGMVLKSRQWVSPTIGYVETEQIIR